MHPEREKGATGATTLHAWNIPIDPGLEGPGGVFPVDPANSFREYYFARRRPAIRINATMADPCSQGVELAPRCWWAERFKTGPRLAGRPLATLRIRLSRGFERGAATEPAAVNPQKHRREGIHDRNHRRVRQCKKDETRHSFPMSVALKFMVRRENPAPSKIPKQTIDGCFAETKKMVSRTFSVLYSVSAEGGHGKQWGALTVASDGTGNMRLPARLLRQRRQMAHSH